MGGTSGAAARAFPDHEFALCLTHDVDRPYKTVQAPYRAVRDRDPAHLRALYTDVRPYWRFEDIMSIEEDFGVRSSFYFLEEKHVTELPAYRWLDPRNWLQFTGHYRLDDPEIVSVIEDLDRGGWEVGIHGSYESFDDPVRFSQEVEAIERVLGHPITGGRQHFLNLDVPETWRIHRDAGLRYDASLGSSTEVGFQHGYDPKRPFGDDFLVFPLTVMEVALLAGGRSVSEAKRTIDRLLEEADRNGAVMTALWHIRLFNEAEFPGYRRLYQYLINQAIERGAWVGSIGEAYARLTESHPEAKDETSRRGSRTERIAGHP